MKDGEKGGWGSERIGCSDTCACDVVETTSARMAGERRNLVLVSGPVMNCVYGAAVVLKASSKLSE